MTMIAALETLVTTLGRLDCVRSSRLGVEANISPADYPLVRVVVESLVPGRPYQKEEATVWVMFGLQITEAEGVDKVTTELLRMQALIRAELQALGVRYLRTVFDRDDLPTYKMAAIQCEVMG